MDCDEPEGGPVEELVLEFARAEQAGDPFGFLFKPQHYLLRTSGGGFQSAELPWSDSLLDDLAVLRGSRPDRVIVQRVGELLRKFLSPLGFDRHAEQIVSASRAGKQVVITLRSAAAELYALPWELVSDKHSGQALGSLPGVLWRYEWPETQTIPESSRSEGGRILFAWSAAGGSVPVQEHLSAITAACEKGSIPFHPEKDVIAHCSSAKLIAALESARSQGHQVAVLHLLCHGGESGSTFGLTLHGEADAEPEVVDAATLRQILAPFADMIRLIVLSACDSGNSGEVGNQLGSVAQALHRAGFCAVLASRLPLAVRASNLLTATLYDALICHSQSLETALCAVRTQLLRDPGRLDWASLQLYARIGKGEDLRPLIFRPYRGLLAFQPEHRAFFFGRQREIEQIQTALQTLKESGKPKLLIVAGASGSGKSSLVLAGVIPRLTATGQQGFRVIAIKPGSSPLEALKQIPQDDKESQVCIVVDQLEEIFTQVHDAAMRTQFVQKLWRLSQQPNVQIIATLRVDFIGECGEVVLDDSGRRLDRIAYDDAHRVFVAQMGNDELRETIEGPARRVGIKLEAGLTSRMLEAVAGEPGALPLLQHTLDQLWLRREARTLTQKGYDSLGQLAGALSQHAESLFATLGKDEQLSAKEVMVRLVRLEDGVTRATRQRVRIDKLRPRKKDAQTRFDQVLQAMTEARLLTVAGEDPHSTVEVAHEALIRSWPRLAEWLKQDQSFLVELGKLEDLIREWKEHRALLVAEQLRFAERLLREHPGRLPEETTELVQKSLFQERKLAFIKGFLLLSMFCGLLVLSLAFFSQQRAQKRAELARHQILTLVSKTSQVPSRAELLRTLGRLRLALELRPDLALAAVSEAKKFEAENPLLLLDEAEYLLASARAAEVFEPAKQAFEKETDPARRLLSAALAWSAARIVQDERACALWSRRVLQLYKELPPRVEVPELYATSQLLIEQQTRARRPLPLPDILAVFQLIHSEKNPRRLNELAKLLELDPAAP